MTNLFKSLKFFPVLLFLLAVSATPSPALLNVEVFVPAQSIFDQTQFSNVSLTALARASTGDMYAFDRISRSILKIAGTGPSAGSVSAFVAESAIIAVTGESRPSIQALAITPEGDLFAADQGSGILRIPTSGSTAGSVSMFLTEDQILTSTGETAIQLSALTVSPSGDLYAASASGRFGRGLNGILHILTSGPNAGEASVFATNDAITALTGGSTAAINGLSSTSSGDLFVLDGGSGGSQSILKIPTSGDDAGVISLCVAKNAIISATGALTAAVSAIAVDNTGTLFAADTGPAASNSILKIPATGPDACTVQVFVTETALLGQTGQSDVSINAAAGGSLYLYDDTSASILHTATTGAASGTMETFVPNSAFFAATGNTAEIYSMAANGSLFASESLSGSLLMVSTSSASAGQVSVPLEEDDIAALTGLSSGVFGPLAFNANSSPDLFIADPDSSSILRALNGTALTAFVTEDDILQVTDDVFVDILAMALNNTGFLLALNQTDGVDNESEAEGIMRIRISDANISYQCRGKQLVNEVAGQLGEPAEDVTVSILTAAMNSQNDLFSYDEDNEAILQIGTGSAACNAKIFVSRDALLATTGMEYADLIALAIDGKDHLYAYDDISGKLLMVPTVGDGAGGISVAFEADDLMAVTESEELELTALTGSGSEQIFAFDVASGSILRIFAEDTNGETDSCREETLFATIECKLNLLADKVTEAALQPEITDNLLAQLTSATAFLKETEAACAEGDSKKSKNKFKDSMGKVKDFKKLVAKYENKGKIPPQVAAELSAGADDAAAVMQELLDLGVCEGSTCLADPPLGAVHCYLGKLIDEVGAAGMDRKTSKSLYKKLAAAQARTENAKSFCLEQNTGKAEKNVKKARDNVDNFATEVEKKAEKGLIPQETAQELLTDAGMISDLIANLIQTGVCAGL